MKNKLKLISILSAILLAGCATSTPPATNSNVTVKVLWADLDTFTDINPGTQAKTHFRHYLKGELENQINSLAAQLPSGYRLYMVIDDIDLAGKVNNHYWRGKEALRVYDTWFNPEITFTYRLKNSAGEFVAAQDKFKLKNTHNGRYPAARFMSKPFAYEKYLLKSWFNHILLPHVQHQGK